MRIFTRQPTQSLLIGEGVSITVLAIRGLQVRLGVEAPRDINIQRGEIVGRTDSRRPQSETGK
jgi:carbon storage regulator